MPTCTTGCRAVITSNAASATRPDERRLMRALTDLTDADVAAAVAQAGGQPFQARQVLHWTWKHGMERFADMKNVPSLLQQALAAGHTVRSTSLARADAAGDGTEKLLLRLF